MIICARCRLTGFASPIKRFSSSKVFGVSPTSLTSTSSRKVPGWSPTSNHSANVAENPISSITRRTAARVPLRRCSQYERCITAIFRSAGQSLSHRSTDSAQARYGSKSTGQAVGVHSVRIATVIPESRAVAASVLRIHAVDDGGSNVLFIRSAVFNVITDIAGGLDIADLDIARGRIYYHSLYPLDMQRR